MFKYFQSVWTVAEREVLAIVQTKGFWFFAIAYPILIGFPFIMVPLSMSLSPLEEEKNEDTAWRYEYFSSENKEMVNDLFWGDPVRFSISDQTGYLYKHIRFQIIAESMSRDWRTTTVADLHQREKEEPEVLKKWYDWSSGLFEEVLRTEDTSGTLDEWLKSEKIAGYFVIPKDLLTTDEPIRFVRHETVSIRLGEKIEKLKTWFKDIVSRAAKSYQLETVHVEPAERSMLLQGIDISIERARESPIALSTVDVPLSKPFHDTNLYTTVSIVFVISFVLVLTGISNAAITSTIEEKSNRLSEILVSNVDAAQVLDGKLLANAIIAMIGIATFCLIIGPIFGAVALNSEYVAVFLSTLLHPPKVVNWATFLFLGMAFYGYIEIALGSLCNNVKESMMTLFPVRFIYTFALWPVLFFVVNKPNGTLAEILSFVPVFTPYVMIARTDALPTWPVYVSIVVLMLFGVLLMRQFAKTLFANGMLLEQKTSTLGRMFKLATRSP